jgi:ATP-dependent helicase/nuclease subunit B
MYEGLLAAVASGSTVVTANNRLARTLRQAFDAAELARGKAAWPSPDILAWPHWLNRLWVESRLRGGQAANYRLVDETSAAALWQQSVGLVEADSQNSAVPQLARAAARTWTLLNEWDVLAAPEWTDTGLTEDQRAFLRWLGEFRRRSERAGWVTGEQLPALLAQDIEAGVFADSKPLLFAGFDEWSPDRRKVLDALTASGCESQVHQPAPLSGRRLGQPCANQQEETLAAASWARRLLEAEPGARIAVVVPDLAARADEVRRSFCDVFAPGWRVQGLPTESPLNISYGQPLAKQPVVSAALALLNATDGRASFSDFSLLLRSPWLSAAGAEAPERAAADIRLRESLLADFGLAEAQALVRRRAPGFAPIVERLIDASRDRETRKAADWAHWITELLHDCGWPGCATLDSDTWQALKAWNELLAAFAGSSHVRGALNHAEAQAALNQLAQQRLFQPEGNAQGVQVMGVLEAAGHNFDYLWVCGMARELWPAAGRPDPFIPLALQRRLGMPDSSAECVLEHAGRVSQRLLASAAHIVCSWPELMDDEALSPSPLLEPLELSAQPPEFAPLWNAQLFGSCDTEQLTNDPPPPWVSSARVRGGASVLNLQSVSPFHAFAEKRLGAFEMRAPPLGIDAMQRGNVTHKVLEEFYRRVPDQSALHALDSAARRGLLEPLIRAALSELPGMRDPLMQRFAEFEHARQLARIEAFLRLDAERPAFRVRELEQLHDVEVGPLKLQLKLDRLDELAQGKLMVIDYKTGRVNRQSWNPDKPRDLQLPLYVTTVARDAAAVAFAQVSAYGIGFDGVGDDDVVGGGIRSPGRKPTVQVRYQRRGTNEVIESWDELREEWAKLLEKLAEEFAAGDYRLDPLNRDFGRGQFAILSRIYDAGTLLEDDD